MIIITKTKNKRVLLYILRRQVLPLDQSEVCIPDCLSMKNSDLHFLGAFLLNS